MLDGLLVKVDHAKHVAVIGDGNGIHSICPAMLHQIFDADGSIKKAVGRMQMQMCEFFVKWFWIFSFLHGEARTCSEDNTIYTESLPQNHPVSRQTGMGNGVPVSAEDGARLEMAALQSFSVSSQNPATYRQILQPRLKTGNRF
jgi:hypothetical protein